MLHVSFQADDFFLNVAAIDQQRGFLQHAFLVDGRAQQLLQAGLQPLAVVLQHGAAMLLHALAGLDQVSHALAQFAGNAAAFFLAHLIQPIQSLVPPWP